MPSGKKFAAARKAVPERPHTIEEAVPLMQKVKFAKFDETVELALRLGLPLATLDQELIQASKAAGVVVL